MFKLIYDKNFDFVRYLVQQFETFTWLKFNVWRGSYGIPAKYNELDILMILHEKHLRGFSQKLWMSSENGYLRFFVFFFWKPTGMMHEKIEVRRKKGQVELKNTSKSKLRSGERMGYLKELQWRFMNGFMSLMGKVIKLMHFSVSVKLDNI